MLKVLLVDDEPFIIQGLKVLIDWEQEGYMIAGTASNGKEAYDFLKKESVDLIIADIQMPVMDGYEATRQIRNLENAALAKIPIVALSANAFEEDRKASREAGMDGHLAKPIEIAKLFGVLKEIIKKE